MIRAWNSAAARIDDILPIPLAAVLLLLLAALIGVLWYTFPAWLPHRWWGRFWRAVGRALRRLGGGLARLPGRLRTGGWRWRLGRPAWRWRTAWRWRWRRRASEPAEPVPPADDALPDRPAHEFVTLADWYAARGRYAEAVRERLRGIVRALVDTGVIEAPPGWTVVELAGAAGRALPVAYPPVTGASEVFSDIWYGQRPASAGDDTRMRGYAHQVSAVLAGTPVGMPR